MSTLAQLMVRIDADVSAFKQKISAAERSVLALSERMTDIGNKLTLTTSLPFSAIGTGAVKAAIDLEKITLALTSVTGSASIAAAQLGRLEEIAKLPGVDFTQAAKASLTFQSIGYDAQFAERAIKGVANVVTRSGGGSQEFESVIRQLRQVAGAGKLMGDELNIILESAPAMGGVLKDAFGTVSADKIRDLGLTTQEFFERLFTSMEKLEQVSGGSATSVENLMQALRKTGATLGEQLLPVVVTGANILSDFLKSVRDLDANTLRWGLALGAVVIAAGPVISVVSTLIGASTALAATLGLSGLAGALVVGGPLIGGLVALTHYFIKTKTEAYEAARAVAAATSKMRGDWAAMETGALKAKLVSQSQASVELQEQMSTLREKIATQKAKERVPLAGRVAGAKISVYAGESAAVRELTKALDGLVQRHKEISTEIQVGTDLLKERDQRKPTPGPLPDPPTKVKTSKAEKTAGERLLESADQLRTYYEHVTSQGQDAVGPLEAMRSTLEKINALIVSEPEFLRLAADRQREQNALLAERVRLMEALRYEQGAPVRGDIPLAGIPTAAPQIIADSGVTPRVMAVVTAFDKLAASLRSFGRSLSDEVRYAVGGASRFFGRIASAPTPEMAGIALLLEVIEPALQALAPALGALLVPINLVGVAFGEALVPVIKATFPLFQYLGVALTYVGEAAFKIAGGLVTALTWILKGIEAWFRAIGTLIAKIPGLGDLSKSMLSAADAASIMAAQQGKYAGELLAGAKGFADARKKILGLSFEDAMKEATNGVKAFGDALRNVPTGFKVALARFNATTPGAGGPIIAPPTGGAKPHVENNVTVHVDYHATPETSTREQVERLVTEIERVARTGGFPRLSLALGRAGV